MVFPCVGKKVPTCGKKVPSVGKNLKKVNMFFHIRYMMSLQLLFTSAISANYMSYYFEIPH